MAPTSQRTAQCLAHVRALNSQFKTWIDKESVEKPDCLWSAGVKDYLDHASHILTEFADVVAWMMEQEKNDKKNLEGIGASKKFGVADNLASKQQWPPTTGASTFWPSTSAAFAVSKGTPQAPQFGAPAGGLFAFGAPAKAPAPEATAIGGSGAAANGGNKKEGEEEGAEEEDEEEPQSPSLKRAEEAGVEVLKEVKAKLWVKQGGEWKAKGAGAVVLKQIAQQAAEGKDKEADGTEGKEKRRVILFRNDAGKVLLTASLPKSGTTAIQQKNALTTTLFCPPQSQTEGTTTPSPQVVPTTVLFRLGSEDEASSLKTLLAG